ncbi:Cell wall-associated polypeptide CWBP200 [uncultured Blautia sp.]|uniref:RHS repeat-associated core domain-containing protein n=2 Tax=Blautia TaxID=572511 RepID=UPI0008222DCD|nr:RHS repeat-associated core domain-containing protein [Blautia acetigignens]MCU6773375.1 RHS repeat-associated core domain-containing protein [Blautia acetigignens]SCH01623.1 Cell wall-associated polypeptide CWBP200 [uncultured Blautia sp.]
MDGAVTQMCYAGDLLVSERTGSEKTLWYRYDSSGNVIALTYESEIYMYLRNAQNDIIGLLDKDGKVVVRYTYDSWGQVVKIEGTLKDKVGARNPFRYKGYYYDVETGLYYCRSRYYDPAIRRFISADDTQVLRDNLDMLGEKNLYAYCDDNPITRVDVNGQFSLICGLIGATMNVLAGGVAAAVTGQEYTVTDMIAAGLAGIFAGGAGLEGAIAGGVVSAVYTAWCSFRRGDSLTAAIINSGTAFLSTVFISNLSGFAVASEGLEKTIAITWGATYGVGAGGIAASVSRGLSMETAETKRQVKNVPHEKKVGQGRHFNGRTGTSFKFSIWKTATGSLKKRPHKTYIPLRARTV